jgi:hypothetical protein
MNENSTSDVGRAAIDTYQDGVEQALFAAHAPRSDRVQVLHDLESQIADMLAQEPAPLTEAAVQAVLAKLEPPSHFAATYGNGKQPPAARPIPTQARGMAAIRWSIVAAGCFALPIIGILLEVLFNLSAREELRIRHSGVFVVLSTMAALVATPGALAMAYRQLRADPEQAYDRDLVMKMVTGYAVIAPALLMIIFADWTYGLILMLFGAVAFLYFQYKLVRRLQRFVQDKLPPRPASTSTNGDPLHEAPPLGSSMSPAVM